MYSFHHGGGIIGCECKICGEMIEAGTNEVNHLISCHIIKHHSLGKGLVRFHPPQYNSWLLANFPKSINNPLPNRTHHELSYVLEIFPQLLLLKVDDNADFDRILCERIFEVFDKPYVGLLKYSTVHDLSCVFYNTNYFCCICDIPYDSGLPSMEIIMEHIRYCLIASQLAAPRGSSIHRSARR